MMERWHKETVAVRRHEELAAARWLRTVAEKEEAEAEAAEDSTTTDGG